MAIAGMIGNRTAAYFVLALGIIAAISAVYSAYRTQEFLRHAVRADGIVVALVAGGSHPRVAFTTDKGEQVVRALGGFIGGWRVGDRVQVLYQSGQALETATMDRPGAIWFATILASILSLVLVGTAIQAMP